MNDRVRQDAYQAALIQLGKYDVALDEARVWMREAHDALLGAAAQLEEGVQFKDSVVYLQSLAARCPTEANDA